MMLNSAIDKYVEYRRSLGESFKTNLSDTGFVSLYLFLAELVKMLREESLHIRLLVICFLPEHHVGKDADAAVALQ